MSKQELDAKFWALQTMYSCIYGLLGQLHDATRYQDPRRPVYCAGRPHRCKHRLGQGDKQHHPCLPAAPYHLQQQKAEKVAKNIAREWYAVSRLCFCIRKLKAPEANQIQPFTKRQKAPDPCFPVFKALKLRQCAEGHQCFTCYFSILENWQKLRCAKHCRPG